MTTAPLPTLLCLHGFLGTGRDWAAVAAALEGHARCLTPDLPGHGGTPLTAGVQSYAAWVQWLADWLDARHIATGAVVGYSLGGRVALAFAAAFPQRVRALALVSAHPGLTNAAQRQARRREDSARAEAIRSRGLAAFLETWYRLPLFGVTAEAQRQALVARRSQQQAEAMARVVAEMSPGRQPPLWEALARLPFPVAYIAGAADAKYAALAATVAQRAPQVQRFLIPQAAHMVPLDAPQALADILAAFLAAFLPLPPHAPKSP